MEIFLPVIFVVVGVVVSIISVSVLKDSALSLFLTVVGVALIIFGIIISDNKANGEFPLNKIESQKPCLPKPAKFW